MVLWDLLGILRIPGILWMFLVLYLYLWERHHLPLREIPLEVCFLHYWEPQRKIISFRSPIFFYHPDPVFISVFLIFEAHARHILYGFHGSSNIISCISWLKGENDALHKTVNKLGSVSVFEHCGPTPPLTKQQSTNSKLGLMSSWGRGGCAIAQIQTLNRKPCHYQYKIVRMWLVTLIIDDAFLGQNLISQMSLTHVNCRRHWNDPGRPDLSARAHSFPFFCIFLDILDLNLCTLSISSFTSIYLVVVTFSEFDVGFEEILIFFCKRRNTKYKMSGHWLAVCFLQSSLVA